MRNFFLEPNWNKIEYDFDFSPYEYLTFNDSLTVGLINKTEDGLVIYIYDSNIGINDYYELPNFDIDKCIE